MKITRYTVSGDTQRYRCGKCKVTLHFARNQLVKKVTFTRLKNIKIVTRCIANAVRIHAHT